jgi:hypothetical protein
MSSLFIDTKNHKAHIYLEYYRVCTLVGIGTPPPTRKRVCPSPEPYGGGGGMHTRLRVRGWESPNSDDDWRNSVAL